MNIFRHWVLWSAVEVAPGKYDWRDYDRMMELEAQNGIQAVLAEFVTSAPEWAYRAYPEARFEAQDGYRGVPEYSGSSATGGFPGLCLDNPRVRAKAEEFLKALAARYKNSPALYGYDLWNEGNTSGGAGTYFQVATSAHIPNEHRGTNVGRMYCYCPASIEEFRKWLRTKYGTLEALSRAWRRYGLTEWSDVQPSRTGGPYPDWLDWLEFKEDRAHELLRWRRDVIRSVDSSHKITMHGIARSLEYLPSTSANDWRAAAEVDSYGFTWVSARQGNEPWKQFHAVDLVRGASRGKPFWHAECQGGPLWMASEVTGRPLEDARKPDGEGHPPLEPDFIRRRGDRTDVPSLPSAARRSAVWRVRPVRNGRFGDTSLRDGGQAGALGQQPRRPMEITPGKRRYRDRLRAGVGALQFRAAG